MLKGQREKILFIQPGYAHYREQLFNILHRRHDIHFVFERSASTYPGEVSPGPISYTFLEKRFGSARISLTWYLFRYKPDIVISSISTSFRSFISYIYARLFKKRFILWILEWKEPAYSTNLVKRYWRSAKNTIGSMLICKCDALVVGGSASRQYALLLGKDERDLFTAMQCANDLGLGPGPRQSVAIRRQNNLTFLYMSRIIPYKGLDLLIRAFSMLRKQRGDTSLLIGGGGPFRQYCEELVSSCNIPDISFLGSIDPNSVVNLYDSSDVFILPSYRRDNSYESWGLVVNEAMSMGLPIITTTAVGAAYDLVKDGHNGFVVRDNNVDELYEAMAKMLRMDLKKMGLNSRALFDQKNDFVQMANGFTSAIEHVHSK